MQTFDYFCIVINLQFNFFIWRLEMAKMYKLTKKFDGNKHVNIPADNVIGGILIAPGGKPYFVGKLLEKFNIAKSSAEKVKSYKDLTEELKNCVVRIGDYEDYSCYNAEELFKSEKDRQNAFMKEKGYRWEKYMHYVDGYEAMMTGDTENDGEFVERWRCKNKEGEVVNFSEKLILEGYYGQDKIDEYYKDKEKEREEIKLNEAIANAEKTVREFTNNNDNIVEYPEKFETNEDDEYFSFRKSGHNIYGSGVAYCIRKNNFFKIQNNGMDGDDWSRNNMGTGGAGAIAIEYKYDENIVSLIKKYALLGQYN